MKYFLWIFTILIISFSSPATAEFYKYIDNNGSIRFTDDYSTVPRNQRTNTERYDEYENRQEPASASIVGKKGYENPQVLSNKSKKELEGLNAKDDLDEIQKRLVIKNQEMALEYKTLQKERQALVDKQKSLTLKDMKQLNENISMFNEKIESFRKKREALNKEIEQYNTKVAEENKAAKKGMKKISQ